MVTSHPDPRRDAQFYDGVGLRRLIAFIIDAAVIAAVAAPTLLVFGVMTFGFGFALALPIVLAISVIYRVVSVARWSATPGMRACGVELRGWSGGRLTDGEAAVHTLTYVGCFFFVAPQLVSVALMALTPAGRGLADLAVGAVMINRPA